MVLDPNKKAFMLYIATITSGITIYLECKAQITLLQAEKASVSVSAKYLDFTNVFSEKVAAVLPEHTEINTYAIDLEEDKQLPY